MLKVATGAPDSLPGSDRLGREIFSAQAGFATGTAFTIQVEDRRITLIAQQETTN